MWGAMIKTDHYRDYAAECMRLAGSASDPLDRIRLIDMAAKWLEIAKTLERLFDSALDQWPTPARIAERPN